MALSFDNVYEVFVFILLCSVYVCSILWLYGDAVSRKVPRQGVAFVLLFLLVGSVMLLRGMFWLLLIWLGGYGVWFCIRPAQPVDADDAS